MLRALADRQVELARADARARGEGYGLSAVNFSEPSAPPGIGEATGPGTPGSA